MSDETPIEPVVSDRLALALVQSSDAPILLLDAHCTVIAASASFARAFRIDPSQIAGRLLFDIGDGAWDVPQLRALLRATLSGAAQIDAYEMDLQRANGPVRRLVLTAHQLDHGAPETVRLLLTVSDVTDARLADRLKDDLLREKAILFQELQHRVANSLQIIASVLMQTARRVPSTETKGYLFDAHSRVMSIAALQRQLATSSLSDVHLRGYFTDLCESIGASMIVGHDLITLKVDAEDGVATADTSVSLGLIVTELVINALKHAFPEGRSGQIVVGYTFEGPAWTLSVEDNGIGMPKSDTPTKGGLGTSIVQALSKQLDARIDVTDTKPGTRIAISHAGAVLDTGVTAV